MHNDTDGALIEFRDHTLTVDEFHAAVLGLIALPIASVTEAIKPILKEPHYFIGSLVLAYVVGRRIRPT